MNAAPIRVKLGETWVSWDYSGPATRGSDRILLDEDDDLCEGLSWASSGFTVVPFLSPEKNRVLREQFTELVANGLRQLGVRVSSDFSLARYHDVIDKRDSTHLSLVSDDRFCLARSEFPIPMSDVEERLSAILHTRVQLLHTRDAARLRIVRPRSNDNNPPHRDVWLDRLRNAINIYFPLAGSDARSSLPILPGSHRWPESAIVRSVGGAQLAHASYTVPCVVATDAPFEMIRPNPREDEVLVFSPYLIHGGAKNLNDDTTRVSLEMRFCRKTD